ncbi:MAG: 5-deoxy-glucuronate isomerase [Rudaea sp.]|uniref:5-deoxy-glucuronate isomerase n=1 Tax=unclassified Rudaea TaxID=2627037 RepID=UPI0010F883F9|nr:MULTISPECIES: 5-deoxy-glucuronate isomerase [unclassified Rudaea]MBN8887925.1 5-deoxy-glucuronate isomerase [Rudaea sp.]MBR0347024.1 5-deoxy-glucuronate isomerase [Rudaea sp.]
MSLLVKAQRDASHLVRITPQSAGWRHVGFDAWHLAAGEELQIDVAEDRETCLAVLRGAIDFDTGALRRERFGGRASVFDAQPPHALYLPPRSSVRLRACDAVELALASAPATGRYPARIIEPAAMPRSTRGTGSNERYICDVLPQSEDAESLLVVEVRTPAAHSSSYPPHKHDADDPPRETQLEEIYYHRIDPPQGFAFQRVYTDAGDLDETMAPHDHDVVLVPRGYHPVVMPHGYRGYYLNVMAGPRREWRMRNDPAHEWMLKL